VVVGKPESRGQRRLLRGAATLVRRFGTRLHKRPIARRTQVSCVVTIRRRCAGDSIAPEQRARKGVQPAEWIVASVRHMHKRDSIVRRILERERPASSRSALPAAVVKQREFLTLERHSL